MSQNQFKNLADFISSADLPPQPKLTFTQSELFQCWQQAAGKKVAEQTENLNVVDDLLEVQVCSPTWAHEVINRQTTILERMHKSGFHKLTALSVSIFVRKPIQIRYRRRAVNAQHAITPELRSVFRKIAKNSGDATTKKQFERLSKIKS